MSGSKKGIPNKAIDLLVSEVFRKNGVNIDSAKSKLSDEQKQNLKELVEDLKSQVDDFVNDSSSEKKD